jgi:hypothetical protein
MVQVPAPPVIVTVPELMEHTPDTVMETGKAEVAVALTPNVLPYAEVVGVVASETVWPAIVTLSIVLVSVAEDRSASPA